MTRSSLGWVKASAVLAAPMGGLVVLAAANAVWAQQLPGAVEAGRAGKQVEQTLPRAQARPGATVLDSAEQLPPDQAERIRFTLGAVTVDGATALPPDVLAATYGGLIGQEISLRQLYGVAEAMTAEYRNRGYILARAIVPPQTIDSGAVRLHVVEGYINDVILDGDLGNRPELWQDWAARIKASRPLDVAVLERYTLLANDLAGTRVQAKVRPSATTPGAADLVLSIGEKMVDAFATLDNRGTETQGPLQATSGVTVNNALGLFEQTAVTMATALPNSQELRYLAARHTQFLGHEGTRLDLTASLVHSMPGAELDAIDMRTRTRTVGVQVSHPLVRSRAENLSLYGGFTGRNAATEQLGAVASKDSVRSLQLGGRYDLSDSLGGITLLDLTAHQGLDALGANAGSAAIHSRAAGQTDFTKLTATVTRDQDLGVLGDGLNGFSAFAALTGQWSDDPLLASEEFGFGGAEFGRAYDSSEITGDQGAAAVVELRWTASGLGESAGAEAAAGAGGLLTFMQLYSFYDFGVTWDHDPVNQRSQRTGASVGVGVRGAMGEALSGALEIAKPTTRGVGSRSLDDDEDPRLFFSLSARF